MKVKDLIIKLTLLNQELEVMLHVSPEEGKFFTGEAVDVNGVIYNGKFRVFISTEKPLIPDLSGTE